MRSCDITPELAKKHSQETANGGVRTSLSQSVVKNIGEHFVNLIVYGLADLLKYQDEILVVKGCPAPLRSMLTVTRQVSTLTVEKQLTVPIEVDMAIFRRSDPTDAILVNAKINFKTAKLSVNERKNFDALRSSSAGGVASNMLYVFATADTGSELDRQKIRNDTEIIGSYFDYSFVAKTDNEHVASNLAYGGRKESLFHELGCLMDLIQQKFKLEIPTVHATTAKATLDGLFAPHVYTENVTASPEATSKRHTATVSLDDILG